MTRKIQSRHGFDIDRSLNTSLNQQNNNISNIDNNVLSAYPINIPISNVDLPVDKLQRVSSSSHSNQEIIDVVRCESRQRRRLLSSKSTRQYEVIETIPGQFLDMSNDKYPSYAFPLEKQKVLNIVNPNNSYTSKWILKNKNAETERLSISRRSERTQNQQSLYQYLNSIKKQTVNEILIQQRANSFNQQRNNMSHSMHPNIVSNKEILSWKKSNVLQKSECHINKNVREPMITKKPHSINDKEIFMIDRYPL